MGSKIIGTISVGIIACLISTPAYGQLSRYEKWQQSRLFTIGAMYYDGPYGPAAQLPAPENVEPDMAMFRYAGLNLLSDVSHSNGGHQEYPGVSAAQEDGMPFMILGAGWAGTGGATPMDAFRNHVKFFADDPKWSGFCGVQIADEPRDEQQRKDYRAQRDWIVETYPQILTLTCETLTNYPAWEKQYESIRPDALIFQWYPYHTSDVQSLDISDYCYATLDRASQFCQERRIGYFLARGANGTPKSDTLLRISTFAPLAHGCKGFIDWSWDSSDWFQQPQLIPQSPDVGYVWYARGKPHPTPHLEKLARINREIANLGPALLKLRHVRTCHINSKGNAGAGPIYNFNDTDNLRTGKLTQVTGTTDHIMIGFFRDQTDQEYFMVVNKHNARDPHSDERNLLHKITLTFADEVKAIEKLSRFTGHVEHLNLRDHQLSFFLPGGTGDLFKYATGMPFAGIER